MSGGDDVVRGGGPDEGLWVLVVLVDETVDGGLKVDDGMEDAVLQAPSGELGEEALHGVQHELEVGVKWKVRAGLRNLDRTISGVSA